MKEEQQQSSQPIAINEFDGFEKVYTSIYNSGAVWRHEKVKQTVDDYPDVYEIAVDKAKEGCIVKILPILNEKDPLRLTIFAGAKANKCPDMSIDGCYVDVKTPKGSLSNSNIDDNIKKGYKQANVIVVRIAAEYSYTRLKFIAKPRFERHADLEIVEFKIIGGGYIRFTRASIMK